MRFIFAVVVFITATKCQDLQDMENLRLEMEAFVDGLNRRLNDLEHKLLISICHGADASSIFVKSCRDLETSTTAAPPSSTTQPSTTQATSAFSIIINESSENSEDSSIPEPLKSETSQEIFQPTEYEELDGSQIDLQPKNDTNDSQVIDLDRECPTNIGPLTTCYDLRPEFGCYCLVVSQKNWWDAARFCQTNAMQLISLETAKEQQAIQGLIVNSRVRFSGDFVRGLDFGWWTSGSDEGAEGRWIWTGTGKPVQDLGRGLPDDESTSHNGLLLYSDGFIWIDAVMADKTYFICEF